MNNTTPKPLHNVLYHILASIAGLLCCDSLVGMTPRPNMGASHTYKSGTYLPLLLEAEASA